MYARARIIEIVWNIKIASRIIIFFNKIRYVIRYVGFRDVIISIHVKKKKNTWRI